jgi:hypothetical protein
MGNLREALNSYRKGGLIQMNYLQLSSSEVNEAERLDPNIYEVIKKDPSVLKDTKHATENTFYTYDLQIV